MWRADSFEKTLMLGKIEGRRRRGRQRVRWLDGITDSMDMGLGGPREMDREAWRAAVHGGRRVGHDWATERLTDHITGGAIKWKSYLGKCSTVSSKDKNLPCDLIITLLGIYSRDMKTKVYTKTHLEMLTAALSAIAPNWKQSRCHSTSEQLKTMVHSIHRAFIFVVYLLSHVWFFATSRTVTRQAPLSMGFPRQEYWSGLSFPTPEDLPDPRTEPTSPALAGGFFITEPPGYSK